jgi:hypothetical protein
MTNTETIIKCEQCGEGDATVHLADASYCDSCFEKDMKQHMRDIFAYEPCCSIIWHNGQPGICVAVAGTEHDHS